MFAIAAFSQTKVYIDPTAPSGGNGTIDQPLNSVPTIQSNTTYLFKAGTTTDIVEIKAIGLSNLKFTTYGGTERARFNMTEPENKRAAFNVNCEHVVIENFAVDGKGNLSFLKSMGTYVKTDDITVSNCIMHNFISGIRVFTATNIKIEESEIYDIAEDGMFISHCDYVTLLNNNIYKINQLFFTAGTSQKDAPGDGIQLEPVKNWTVIGNHIDRSDTGNKFAFIANNRDSAGVKILQNNVFTGPYNAGDGGAIMYITGAADKIDISGNTFIMGNTSKPVLGIYQTVDNAHIHDNLFVNVESSMISNDAVFENNKYAGIDMQLKPYLPWTGTNNVYIGDATDIPDITVPVDTTGTTPPDTTGTTPPDTTGTTPPDTTGTTPPDTTTPPDNGGSTDPGTTNPPSDNVYYTNCGGIDYRTIDGVEYSADQSTLFKGGSVDGKDFEIKNTDDDKLYLSNRYGTTFSYAFPVQDGNYKVVLHFADIYWRSAEKRIFNVDIENYRVLDKFDINAETGSYRTALTKEFETQVKDGALDILFTSVVDHALISAIDIIPTEETITGIDHQKEQTLLVYPVPAHDYITVDLGRSATSTSTISIFDITGKMALTSVMSAGNSQQRVDISKLTPGIYFVVVPESQNNKQTKKIIVH